MFKLNRSLLKRPVALFILSACLILALSISGCKKPADSVADNGTKKTSGKKIITITVNNGPLEGEDKRIEEHRRVSALFHKKYPEAQIEASTWQYSPESFIMRVQGGNCTDVVGLFASEAATVVEKKLVIDITDMIEKWEHYKYVNKPVLGPMMSDGRLYGLPVGGVGGSYVMTLFYNKEIFKEAGIEKAPETWEEFIEISKKLTDRSTGRAGFGILGEKGGAGWHFLNWGWQAGGDFEVLKDGKWTAAFGSPEVIKALQFVKDMKWKHNILQDDILCDNDDLFEQFSSGRIAMAIFTPEYLVHLIEKFEMPYEKIGIALLPAGPGGHANQMGGAYSIINPMVSEEMQEWALKSILFEFDLDTIELRCQIMKEQGRIFGFGVIPVFHGEYQDKVEAIVDKYRTVPGQPELMQKAAKYIRPEPPYYCQQLYSEFLGPAVQKVLTDKDADPAKLLKDAADIFQSRYLDKVSDK
jgi:multiple sugar transport system substrate-binding protein